MTSPRVVVVGAGPTGATTAILLGQRGVPVLVLDRWSELYPQPRAVHLDDEVGRIVARLGLADEFAAVSRPGAGLRLLAPDHRVLAQFDRDNPLTTNGFPQANMFDQPDLETLLRTRMKAFASIEFRGNVEVDNLRADENGRPVVEFTDTVTGAREEVIADYVLGCDGANSTVRQAMGSAMTLLRFDPQRWLVVDIATDRELGHWDGVHQVCDARRAATYMRIGPDRHRWEIQLLDHENPDQYGDLTALAPLLRPWAADTSSFRLVRVTEYTFRAQIADRWRRGSVFILGDAAHLTPPFIGQGMGAGIRDAANLAWKIAGVLDGSLDAAVLDTYEQARKPHARAMIRLAMIVGRAMTGGGPLGDRLRRHVVPLLPLVPGLRRRVLDSATPALSASCLVHRSRHRRDLAGTLCPNTVLDDGMRLDEAAAGRFVLVAAGCPDVTSAQLIGIRPRRDSDLGRWLRRGRATAALVRPDGTVARAGTVAAVLGALWFPHLHQPAPIEQY